jgi:RIO kinase 1
LIIGVVLKPKIRLEEIKDFKIEKKVFDEKTLYAIYKLMTKGFIKTVESFAKEGKESAVVSGKDKNGNWIAIKVYRIEYSNFKYMWQYLASDPRFSSLKKDRRSVVFNWCKREFKNLKIAHEAGVSCPMPITFNENVLVTELIGENGKLAPTLSEIKFNLDDSTWVYDFILDQLEKIVKAGLIHTDFSSYNILFFNKPYLIDFSQAVPIRHARAKEFLKRDIKNINVYFKNLDVEIKNEDELFDKLSKMME